nr:hypothetical protein [uncultured Halomonas sp.]
MPLFFIHIPKTAGTSFRLGAEQAFDKARIVYDYGKASEETSPVVQQWLYQHQQPADFWRFGQALGDAQAALLGGHVNIGRFVSLLGAGNSVTFLREPLQRMASEYAHFVRHYGYKGSFHDFYSRPVMHNRQSKILHGVDIESIGFVGLTERYTESLNLLNAHFGINIPQREDNRGKKSVEAVHEISAEDEAEFKHLNKQDIALYQRGVELFDARYRCFQKGTPWAHARLVEASVQRVAGWAWWAQQSDDPVQVEIWVNGERLNTVSAVELRPGLCRLLPPRGGYIGFHLPVTLAPGDQVQCRVAGTQQWFPAKPRRISEPEVK